MGTYKDYSGMKFNRWLVLKRTQIRPAKYLCKCDCGIEKENFLNNLKSSYSTSCSKCQWLTKATDLIGKRFHFLTILGVEKINGVLKTKIHCDCGKVKFISYGKIQKSEGPRKPSKYISCGECQIGNLKQKSNFRCLKEGFKKGRLTIIKELEKGKSLALCDCGIEKEIKIHHMKIPYPSCGCYIKERNIENAKKLEGINYFYLKIIKFIGMGNDKRSRYLMKCKCGNKFEKSISYLFGSKSCGCLHKEKVPKGSKNYNAKLSESDVRSMREFYNAKCYTIKELSKMYEISYTHTCSLVKMRSWKHV